MWECQGWQRHLIIQRIVEHVLHRHLSLAPESLHIVSGQLDYALLEKGTGIHLDLHVCLEPSIFEATMRCSDSIIISWS